MFISMKEAVKHGTVIPQKRNEIPCDSFKWCTFELYGFTSKLKPLMKLKNNSRKLIVE